MPTTKEKMRVCTHFLLLCKTNKLLSTIFESITIPLYVIKTDSSAKIHTPGKGANQTSWAAGQILRRSTQAEKFAHARFLSKRWCYLLKLLKESIGSTMAAKGLLIYA